MPGYEARYEVSNQGRVRGPSGKILKPGIDSGGYPLIVLTRSRADQKSMRVHALVALAFLGPRPPRAEVRHLDGDRLNANLSNLQYGSRSENVRDSIKHGTHYTPFRQGAA